MADIQQYSVSIKFKTEGSEATEEKVKKLQEQLDKLKGSGKGFDLGSIVNVSKLGTVASKVGGVLKTVVTSIFSEKTGKAVANATKSMSDYIETVNLFRTSLGAAADEATNFVNKAESELGLDPDQLMHSISSFYNLADGLGIANDEAYLMAQNLTQLTGDLSSFANISQKTAEQKLMSGFSGQVKPLREYGIALDQASLQELAYSLGIEQRVKTMTRAQKTELIYYQIMKSTQKMQGDLSRTLLSPANSLRVLQTEFKQLTRAVGSIFIPGMMRIVPVVRAITKALTEAAKSIANFFGFEITDYYADLSDVGTLLDGVADDIGDVGDEAEGTAKKLNKMLMPFDELNNITSNTGTGGSGSGTGGAGYGGSLGIDLPTYDMFQGDGLMDLIKNGDWKGAIMEIGRQINEGLANIPWEEIQRNVRQSAENIATALNIGITTIDWNLVGSTIGEGLNTALGGISTFIATFDFKATGKAIGNTMNGLFDSVDWDIIGKTLSDGFIGALDVMISGADTFDSGKVYDAIFKVVTNVNWEELGKKLFEHIKKALGYSPIALIVKGWMKIVEAGINWILSKIGGIRITVPDWIKEMLGLPKDAAISLEINQIDLDVDKAFDSFIDAAFQPNIAGMSSLGFGMGKEIGDNISDGVSESDLTTETPNLIEKSLDQSNNSNSWGVNTIREYLKGVDSKEENAKTSINNMTGIVSWLDQSDDSKSWGVNTIREYLKGVDSKEENAKTSISNMTGIVSWLDQSSNSNNWGSSTINQYDKGIDGKQKDTQTSIGKITGIVGWLNQSGNSNSWGSSTITSYENGINSQNNSLTTVINSVQGKIKNALSNYNTSYQWGSDMARGYADGLQAKANSENGLLGVVKSVSKLVWSYLHCSRPEIGPLRDYETWMPDMVAGLSNSLLKALPQLNNAMAYASESLMKEFTDNTLPDSNVTSNVIWNIANKASSANKDNTVSNMATATYSAISRALAENKSDSMQQIVVNVGNKTVYEGFGTYRDEESKRLGVNT